MQALLFCSTLLLAADDVDRQSVIVVVGAPGTQEYGKRFDQWAQRWEDAAQQAGARVVRIGPDDDAGVEQRQRLQEQLSAEPAAAKEPLWLVLIGHGTYDGRQAKFNLRGPDVSASQLAAWLEPLERPLAIINCASASGPFVNRLSAPGRVIVTAAKSGYELNYARFGDYLSLAIADSEADLDKDEQTSLLESFLAASAQVEEFYSRDGRLATEHALVDDNGDALGTPAPWYRGVRATRAAKDGAEPDGLRANQMCLIRSRREQSMPPDVRARRDALEAQVEQLRETKKQMPQEEYYRELETIMLELARLYDQLGEESEEESAPSG